MASPHQPPAHPTRQSQSREGSTCGTPPARARAGGPGVSRRWPLALGLALVAACAAPLDDPQRFMGGTGCPQGLDVEADVLAVRCAGSVCHSPGDMPAGGLDLVSPDPVERVAGVDSPNCSGQVLAVPGDPDASLIIRKLSDSPPCGSRMPLVGDLPADEAACIRDWIEEMPAQVAP
jgi:hypothetical protein